jgi:hypothetical protein
MKMNSTEHKLGRLGKVFATVGAVIDVATAIEARRQPSAKALQTLGIDEKAFRQVNL